MAVHKASYCRCLDENNRLILNQLNSIRDIESDPSLTFQDLTLIAIKRFNIEYIVFLSKDCMTYYRKICPGKDRLNELFAVNAYINPKRKHDRMLLSAITKQIYHDMPEGLRESYKLDYLKLPTDCLQYNSMQKKYKPI